MSKNSAEKIVAAKVEEVFGDELQRLRKTACPIMLLQRLVHKICICNSWKINKETREKACDFLYNKYIKEEYHGWLGVCC